MKTLTIIQPYASLVVSGAKRFETRSWPTKHRGNLAIHASLGFTRESRNLCKRRPFWTALLDAGICWYDEVPCGAVLGIVRMVGCHRTEDVREILSVEELAFGDYSDGRYAWEFAAVVRRFEQPSKAKGSLGIWEWEPPVAVWSKYGRG